MIPERRLPHWQPEGKDLFITWRLHGSLPSHRFVAPEGLTGGRAFVWMDRYLDQGSFGPLWLNRQEVAAMVAAALHYGQDRLNHYQLHAYAIMANHVHALLTPRVHPSKLLHSLKGYTAREGNILIGRTGHPFWQRESYDHWVRDVAEFERIKVYIENNPVKAGLVAVERDYLWSSAGTKEVRDGLTAVLQAR